MHDFNVNLYTIVVLVALTLILIFALRDTTYNSFDNIGDNNLDYSQIIIINHTFD